MGEGGKEERSRGREKESGGGGRLGSEAGETVEVGGVQWASVAIFFGCMRFTCSKWQQRH